MTAPKPKPHVPPVDPAWLDRVVEAPIPVDCPVVDGHFHLWDYSEPPYFGDVYGAEARAAGFVSSVYVECSMAYRESGPEAERVVGEVEFARDQAERHSTPDFRLAEAIVGTADVRLGAAIAPVLEDSVAAGGGRFRGIRVRAATDPDPAVGYGAAAPPAGLLLQSECLKALKVLHAMGLTLDAYLFHTQLDDIAALAWALPDLPIVVNHLGGPLGGGRYADRRLEVAAHWRAAMARLAPFDNVSVKIAGLAISRLDIVRRGERADPPGSVELAAAFEPWFDYCLNTLGAARCLYGSNFPVDKVAMSLGVQVNAMKRLAGRLSATEAAAVLGGTARRIYRLA